MNSVNHLFGCHDVSLAIWFARIDRLSHLSNIIEVFFRDVTATSQPQNEIKHLIQIRAASKLAYCLKCQAALRAAEDAQSQLQKVRQSATEALMLGGMEWIDRCWGWGNGFTCGAVIFCLEFLINLSMAQWAGRLIMLQNILKYVCISLYMIYLYIIHLFLFPLMIVSLQFQSKIQWFHDHSHHVGLEAKRQLAEAQEQMVSERQSKEALQALLACGRCG